MDDAEEGVDRLERVDLPPDDVVAAVDASGVLDGAPSADEGVERADLPAEGSGVFDGGGGLTLPDGVIVIEGLAFGGGGGEGFCGADGLSFGLFDNAACACSDASIFPRLAAEEG